jgi:hypothetical protein
MTKIIRFTKDGFIDPAKVKNAVYNRIDFNLPDIIWDKIDTAFGLCWNYEIGLRGDIYLDEIVKFISFYLKDERILFDNERIEIIVDIMLDYISMTGGLLDE